MRKKTKSFYYHQMLAKWQADVLRNAAIRKTKHFKKGYMNILICACVKWFQLINYH